MVCVHSAGRTSHTKPPATASSRRVLGPSHDTAPRLHTLPTARRHWAPRGGRRTAAVLAPRPSHARVVEVLDEAAERVIRVELLALQLGARRGRGVVGLEPLLDGAALVSKAIRLYCVRDGDGRRVLGNSARGDDVASSVKGRMWCM